MGSGKTTNIIREMNEHPENKYVFITPYLKEGKRVINECQRLKFYEPDGTISKAVSFEMMIKSGVNVVSTHELFKRIKPSKETLSRIVEYGYHLIIDEDIQTIDQIQVSKSDDAILRKVLLEEKSDGTIECSDKKYSGRFADIMTKAKNKSLFIYENSIMWSMPCEMIMAFSSITIMTFRYDYSLMNIYMRNLGFVNEYYHIKNNEIVRGLCDLSEFIRNARLLIKVYEGKLNYDSENPTVLSVGWYKRKGNAKEITNRGANYFRHISNAPSSKDCMWCTFKGSKRNADRVIRGYVNSELACNARATNEFRDRQYLSYLCNNYINPIVKRYTKSIGFEYHDDEFALSTVLQWVWRSAIRDGKEINLYIPSGRMRNLLSNWLDRVD